MRKYIIIGLIYVIFFGACNAGQNSGEQKIKLPAPDFTGKISVEAALKARRSVRRFADKPLSLKNISQLLWAAYGITQPLPEGSAFLRGGKRTAPSAGALYPLEIYLVATNVVDLPPGIYRYDSEEHFIHKIEEGNFRNSLAEAALGQAAIRNAPLTLVYAAVFQRSIRKYGTRARERYVWMEAGHSAQNVCLQAIAINLGSCVMGAFHDDQLKKVVGLRDDEEPLYLQVIGKNK